jgi:hypothetical protein
MDDVTKKVKQLLDDSPSLVDRAFRAYALNAALQADKDGMEFKKLIKHVLNKAIEDRIANAPREVRETR